MDERKVVVMSSIEDIKTFYHYMDTLRDICGGYKILADCHGRMPWSKRGVYFFFEPGEERKESGSGLRVVRVGTHAVSTGSNTKLWNRLSQHKGTTSSGGGNHRGSIFRLHVGCALAARDSSLVCETWLTNDVSREIKKQELFLEQHVSNYIQNMPFLWIDIDDVPSKDSKRSYFERNSIALLSNYNCTSQDRIDTPSSTWLGQFSLKEDIRKSGLWNINHIKENYNPDFLLHLKEYIQHVEN